MMLLKRRTQVDYSHLQNQPDTHHADDISLVNKLSDTSKEPAMTDGIFDTYDKINFSSEQQQDNVIKSVPDHLQNKSDNNPSEVTVPDEFCDTNKGTITADNILDTYAKMNSLSEKLDDNITMAALDRLQNPSDNEPANVTLSDEVHPTMDDIFDSYSKIDIQSEKQGKDEPQALTPAQMNENTVDDLPYENTEIGVPELKLYLLQ